MQAFTQPTKPDRLRQLITVFAILSSFVINTLSNLYPLNGKSIGEISNTQFANVLITPANYAFAIWGVIYLGLIGFAVYQFLPPTHQHAKLRPISYLLVLACVAQAAWVYLFLLRLFALSLLAMLVILLCLIGIYQQLSQGGDRRSWQDKWLLQTPFSVYLGWISVATVVNVALTLYDAGWNGWGIAPEIWTIIMLGISSALAIGLLLQRQDLAFAAVIVWALVAIAVKRANVPLIAVTAIGLAIGLVLVGVISSQQRMIGNR